MRTEETDEKWMRLALEEAALARSAGEVPVGAVIVEGEELLSRAHNAPIALNDPSAHAELLAIRRAAAARGNYRLTGTTLYATLEPCLMCAGAIIQARIGRVVFGARRSQERRRGQPLPPLRRPAAEPRRGGHGGGPPRGLRRNFKWFFSRKEATITVR